MTNTDTNPPAPPLSNSERVKNLRLGILTAMEHVVQDINLRHEKRKAEIAGALQSIANIRLMLACRRSACLRSGMCNGACGRVETRPAHELPRSARNRRG